MAKNKLGHKYLLLTLGGSLIIVLLVGLASNYYLNREVKCDRPGYKHLVVIKDDIASPGRINAPLCDSLTIINQDAKSRNIAFGKHDKHVAYAGVTEQVLGQGDSLYITFNKLGEYVFHDHDNEKVGGSINVEE